MLLNAALTLFWSDWLGLSDSHHLNYSKRRCMRGERPHKAAPMPAGAGHPFEAISFVWDATLGWLVSDKVGAASLG